MNDNHFSHFHIAGFVYYDGVDVFNKLEIGTELKLQAEPQNGYDPKAVAIFYGDGDAKLGYVPKEHNELLSKFLNLGYTDLFEVKVNQVQPDESPQHQIGVVVRIKRK
jgi:hypothetical protein